MQETGFEPWVGKIPLEKEMAIHSSTIAWKIPWTEGLVGYSLWGHKESDTTERFHFTGIKKITQEFTEKQTKIQI